MTARRTTAVFAGFRFPPEVISVAVRWYPRYGLSYRDVEELLAERGVTAGSRTRSHRTCSPVPLQRANGHPSAVVPPAG